MFFRLVPLFLLGFVFSGLGCSDERAAACAQDQTALRSVIARDQQVAKLLHEADDDALAGRPVAAADRIEKGAQTAIGGIVDDARAISPRTKWGAARKSDVLALTERRKELLAAYAEALRSEDLERVVAQMERQRDLEKRALEVHGEVSATPSVTTGLCDPP